MSTPPRCPAVKVHPWWRMLWLWICNGDKLDLRCIRYKDHETYNYTHVNLNGDQW